MLIASLAAQSLLAWLLLPSGRGDYAVLAVAGTLVPSLLTFGLDRSINYHLMSGRIDLPSTLGSLCVLLVSSVALSGGVIATAMHWGYLPQLRGNAVAWLVLMLLSAGSLAHSIAIRLHVAVRGYRHYLLANLLQSMLSVVVLFAVLVLARSGYVQAIGALAASYLLAATVSSIWLGRRLSTRIRLVPRPKLRGIFGFGIRSYPTAIAHAIDFNAGVLVLAAIAVTSEVGIYAALSALMLRFLVLAQALQEALLPRIAADAAGRWELVEQMSRLAVGATVVALGVFLPIAGWIVGKLLSPAFLAGIGIIWWMAPGIAAHAASAVLMPYFEGRGRPGVVSVATWVGMSLNIAGLVVLYPMMGLPGAGLALTLGLVSRFVVLQTFFRAINGASFRSLLVPRRADAEFGLAALRGLMRRVGLQ